MPKPGEEGQESLEESGELSEDQLDNIADNVGEDDEEESAEDSEGGDEGGQDREKVAKPGKEVPKTVPYTRLQKEIRRRKEALKWRAEHEPNITRWRTLEADTQHLLNSVRQFPFFAKFLGGFYQKGYKPDWKGLNAEVTKLAEANPAAAEQMVQRMQEQAPENSQAQEALASMRDDLAVLKYETYFSTAVPSALSAIKKDPRFKGVEVDEEFKADLRELIPAEVARLEQAGQDASRPNVLLLALRLAKREQARADRILGRVGKGAKQKQGAALVDSDKASGKTKPKIPNGADDPDGFTKAMMNKIGDLSAVD